MIDPQSRTWVAVLEWAENEIRDAAERLEQPGGEPAYYDVDRGRIRALRDLIAHGQRHGRPSAPVVIPGGID